MARTTMRPQRWTPPEDPGLTGVWAPTASLDGAELWPVPGRGPEDVAIDAGGRALTGLSDGRVLRFPAGGGTPGVVAELGGGQILGVELLPDGRVLCCHADRGLVAVDPDGGTTEVLLTEVAGRPLVLTNNATVAGDGAILFTESSRRWTLDDYELDLLEQTATGSLWRFDPASGDVDRLHTGLVFANGVTLTPDGSAAVVAETGRYALHRVHLTGPDAGSVDAFARSLPGTPDNLSTGPTGTIWCAVPSLHVAALDLLVPRAPFLRKVVPYVPEALRPKANKVGLVLGFDASGDVTDVLAGDGSAYSFVTGMREHDGWLYLSALHGKDALARVRLDRP
ncbi:MAG: SMP-30/gluconolactonase/LRE family protein [Actinobacteria bacterium]|nr:SMP-30/gluconolactonase/LRE family protein [Actinomycetota bacterium]